MRVLYIYLVVFSILVILNVSAIESVTQVGDTEKKETQSLVSENIIKSGENIKNSTKEDNYLANRNAIVHKSLKINIRKHRPSKSDLVKNEQGITTPVSKTTDGSVIDNPDEVSNSNGYYYETAYRNQGNNVDGGDAYKKITDVDVTGRGEHTNQAQDDDKANKLLTKDDLTMDKMRNRHSGNINETTGIEQYGFGKNDEDLFERQLNSTPIPFGYIYEQNNPYDINLGSNAKSDTSTDNYVNNVDKHKIEKSSTSILKLNKNINILKDKVCEDATKNLESFWLLFGSYVDTITGQYEDLEKIENLFVLLNVFTKLNDSRKIGFPIDKLIDKIVKILESPLYNEGILNVEEYINSDNKINIEPCLSGCSKVCDFDSENNPLENKLCNTQMRRNGTSIDQIKVVKNNMNIWLKPMTTDSPYEEMATSATLNEPEYDKDTEKMLLVVPKKNSQDLERTMSTPNGISNDSFEFDTNKMYDSDEGFTVSSGSDLLNNYTENSYYQITEASPEKAEVISRNVFIAPKFGGTNSYYELNETGSSLATDRSSTASIISPSFDTTLATKLFIPHNISVSKVSLGIKNTENDNNNKLFSVQKVSLPSVLDVSMNGNYITKPRYKYEGKEYDVTQKTVSKIESSTESIFQPPESKDVQQMKINHSDKEYIFRYNQNDEPTYYASEKSTPFDINNIQYFDIQNRDEQIYTHSNNFLAPVNRKSVIESDDTSPLRNPKYSSHINKHIDEFNINTPNTDTIVFESYKNPNLAVEHKEPTVKNIPIIPLLSQKKKDIINNRPPKNNLQDTYQQDLTTSNNDKLRIKSNYLPYNNHNQNLYGFSDDTPDISNQFDFKNIPNFDIQNRVGEIRAPSNAYSNDFFASVNPKNEIESDDTSTLQNPKYSSHINKHIDVMDINTPNTDTIMFKSYNNPNSVVKHKEPTIKNIPILSLFRQNKKDVINNRSPKKDLKDTDEHNLKTSDNDKLGTKSNYLPNNNYHLNLYGLNDDTPDVSTQFDFNNIPNVDIQSRDGDIRSPSNANSNDFYASGNRNSVIESDGTSPLQNPEYRNHINKHIDEMNINTPNTDTIMFESFKNPNLAVEHKVPTVNNIPILSFISQYKEGINNTPPKNDLQDTDEQHLKTFDNDKLRIKSNYLPHNNHHQNLYGFSDHTPEIITQFDLNNIPNFDIQNKDVEIRAPTNTYSNDLLTPVNRKSVIENDETSPLKNPKYSSHINKHIVEMNIITPDKDTIMFESYKNPNLAVEHKEPTLRNIPILSLFSQNKKDISNSKPPKKDLQDTDDLDLKTSDNDNLGIKLNYLPYNHYNKNLYGFSDHTPDISTQLDFNTIPYFDFKSRFGEIRAPSNTYSNDIFESVNPTHVIESDDTSALQNPKYSSYINKHIVAMNINTPNTDTIMFEPYKNPNLAVEHKEPTVKNIPIISLLSQKKKDIINNRPPKNNLQDTDQQDLTTSNNDKLRIKSNYLPYNNNHQNLYGFSDDTSDISNQFDFNNIPNFDIQNRVDEISAPSNAYSNGFFASVNPKNIIVSDDTSARQNPKYSSHINKHIDEMNINNPNTDTIMFESHKYPNLAVELKEPIVKHIPSQQDFGISDNDKLRVESYYFPYDNDHQNLYGFSDDTPNIWLPEYRKVQPGTIYDGNKQHIFPFESPGSILDSAHNLFEPIIIKQKYQNPAFGKSIERKTLTPEKIVENVPSTYDYLSEPNLLQKYHMKSVPQHENRMPLNNNKNQMYPYVKSAFTDSMFDHMDLKNQTKLTNQQYSDILLSLIHPNDTNDVITFDDNENPDKLGNLEHYYNGNNNLNNNYDTGSAPNSPRKQDYIILYLLKLLQSYSNSDPQIMANIIKMLNYDASSHRQRSILWNKPEFYSKNPSDNSTGITLNFVDRSKDSSKADIDANTNTFTTINKAENIKRPGRLLLEVFEKIKLHLKGKGMEDKMIDEIINKLYDDMPEIQKADCPYAQYRQILSKVNSAVDSVNQNKAN